MRKNKKPLPIRTLPSYRFDFSAFFAHNVFNVLMVMTMMLAMQLFFFLYQMGQAVTITLTFDVAFLAAFFHCIAKKN